MQENMVAIEIRLKNAEPDTAHFERQAGRKNISITDDTNINTPGI
jgi:hypothetical protein